MLGAGDGSRQQTGNFGSCAQLRRVRAVWRNPPSRPPEATRNLEQLGASNRQGLIQVVT
jgi:hypothetical protein